MPEIKHKNLLDGIHDGVFVLDKRATFVYVNRAMAAAAGQEPSRLVGRDGFECVPVSLRFQAQKIFAAVLRGESFLGLEVDVSETPAEARWVLADFIPVRDKGKVTGVQGVIRDLTENKLLQRRVQAAEAQCRSTIDVVRDAILVVDRDYTILLFNRYFQEWCRDMGLPVDPKGQVLFEALPFLGGNVREGYEQAFRHGQTSTVEEGFMIKDRDVVVELLRVPVLQKGRVTQVITVLRDVTRHKRAVLLGQHNERLLKFAIDQIPVPVIVAAAPDVTVTYMNQPAVDLLAKPLAGFDELPLAQHRDFWPTFYPDGTPYGIEDLPLTRAVKKGEASRDVEILVKKDGEDRWLSVNAAPLVDEQGRVVAGIVVFPDVTEQKRFVAELAEREQELQLLFQKMINAFVLFDSVFDGEGRFVSYRFVYINEAYELITGVKSDEVRGRTVHDVWPGTEPSWVEAYGRVAVTGEADSFEMYHGPTGKFYYCQVYRPGKTPDRFCVIFEDITDRKQAETLLRESEARYRNIFEAAPMAVLEEDLSAVKPELDRLLADKVDLREYYTARPRELEKLIRRVKILDMNERALQLFGAGRKEDLLGNKAVFAVEAMGPFLDQVVALGRGDRFFKGEAVVKTLAGETRDVFYSTAFLGSDKSFDRVQVNLVDMTERKMLEKAKSGLIRDVSHGLKTPIAMAQMGVNILDKGVRTGRQDVINKGRGIVDNNLSRLQREVGSMLEIFARDVGSPCPRVRQPVDLQVLIDGVLEEIMPLIQKKGLSVTRDVSPGAKVISAVKSDLELLLGNLIQNAVKFTDKGTVHISIESAPAQGVRFEVADTGQGIEPRIQDKVFDRFFKGSAASEGSGLGLAICRELVKPYQGEVRLSSPGRDRGTTVTAVLAGVTEKRRTVKKNKEENDVCRDQGSQDPDR